MKDFLGMGTKIGPPRIIQLVKYFFFFFAHLAFPGSGSINPFYC